MRFGHRLDVELDVGPSTLDCLVPRLTLQPVVENALHTRIPGARGLAGPAVTGAMRVFRLHLPLCVLLAGLCSSSCRNLEVVTASYASLEEARREGALAGGWVPEGLPPGTRDIREAHDLDTNRRWGLFSYPPEEADALRRLVRQEEFPLAGVSCDVPARIEWWPVLLRGTLDPEAIRTTGLRAHRAASGDLIFLVNWQQGRAYYWSLDG